MIPILRFTEKIQHQLPLLWAVYVTAPETEKRTEIRYNETQINSMIFIFFSLITENPFSCISKEAQKRSSLDDSDFAGNIQCVVVWCETDISLLLTIGPEKIIYGWINCNYESNGTKSCNRVLTSIRSSRSRGNWNYWTFFHQLKVFQGN